MFEANLLDSEGDIPELFRLQVLRSDSQSSLSRLMGEIDGTGSHHAKDEKSGVKSQKSGDSMTKKRLNATGGSMRDQQMRMNRNQAPDLIDEESD